MDSTIPIRDETEVGKEIESRREGDKGLQNSLM